MKGVLTLVRPWRPSNMTSDPSGASLRATLEHIAGLDVERGLRFASGRIDSYLRRLRTYAASHAGTADELRAAHAWRDAIELRQLAHSLRGVAAFVGAVALQERAAALELALGERPDWDASATRVEALCAAHQALLGAIAALPQAPEAELQHTA